MKTIKLRTLILAAAAVCGSLPVSAQKAQTALPANRIVAPLDEASRVALQGNVAPLAQPRFDEGAAPALEATGRIALILQRSAGQQQALTQYLADLQNPSSPNFHKWLTPAEYGKAYGISDADLETVESWLESHGFRIENVSAARNIVQFSGTFEQVQNAFHTSIHTYRVKGATHFANATDPEIPAALAPVVAGVGPLNDFHAKPAYQPGPKGFYNEASHTMEPELTAGGYLYVTPADAATIYDTPNAALNPSYTGTTYDGTGVSIGIAGDSNVNMPDIQNYRTGFLGDSSSSPNLPTVIIDGNDPGINGDETEALLDNEIAGGLAPKAKVYFYTSAGTDLSDGLFNSILRAINDNVVSILNISFGNCEAAEGTAGNQYLLETFEQAAAQGISVTVSSGDSGSAGCDNDNTETTAMYGFGVNALASPPFVIAVGGTDYDALAQGLSPYVNSAQGSPPYYRTANGYIPEKPWNNSTTVNGSYTANQANASGGATNIVAAGGGLSAVYPKPSFQNSVTPADNFRDIPDVSLLAANGNYFVSWLFCADNAATGESATPTEVDCQNTNNQLTAGTTIRGVGGTSAAAPAFAGMLALVEQKVGSRLGQADFILYALAKSKYSTVFHDLTSGNISVVCTSGSLNCGTNGFLTGYNAGSGYDLASGLGSVDAAALVSNWSSVSLTPTSASLTIDGTTSALNGTHGQSHTFAVAVSPTSATGAASLTITSSAGTTGPSSVAPLAIALNNGTGSAVFNGLPGGTYTVTANYSGDATDATSTSNAINVTIGAENSTTALTVDAYSASTGQTLGLTNIAYGSTIVADAQIAGATEGTSTQGRATGTVTFKDGTTTLGSPNVGSNNVASYPPLSSAFTVFSPGSHSITASYSGDASYHASNSSAVSFTVAKATTTMTATANPTSLSSGSSTVTFTITTPFNNGAAPTGTVTLNLGSTVLATSNGLTGTLNNSGTTYSITGTLNVAASQLTFGSNSITANYSGDSNYATSSANFTIALTGTGPALSLSNSGNITVTPGATTGNTSTITVTPSGGLTGQVNLACSVATSISNPTSGATCSVPASVTISGTGSAPAVLTVNTTSTTSPGAYTVTVTGTDATTTSITGSTTVTVTVNTPPATPSIALTNSGNITVAPGATTGNTSTITVAPSGGFTGAVNLSCAVTTVIMNPTDQPGCSVPSSVTIAGTTGMTATLTVSTTAATSGAVHDPLHRLFLTGGGATLALVLFFGIPARRRAWRTMFSLIAVAVTLSAAGCGGGSGSGGSGGGGTANPGTTAGSYTVTVTGTDAATGKITANTAVALTVN